MILHRSKCTVCIFLKGSQHNLGVKKFKKKSTNKIIQKIYYPKIPAPKDNLIVLHVVTHNIGTLEGVHLVKFDKKPKLTGFFGQMNPR